MKIQELMTAAPATVAPDAYLADAARQMAAHDVGPIPVVHEQRAVGLLTDRDLVVRGIAEGRDPATTRVAEIMTTETVCCRPTDDADGAARIMAEHGVRRLLVEDEAGHLKGVVSLGDLAHGDALPDGQGRQLLATLSAPSTARGSS